MKESRVILCTGGIGSGKSCIVKALSVMGIPSYDTDSAVKHLYDTDCELLSQIREIAGEDVVTDGKLQKKKFSEKIFSDIILLHRVEGVVHPALMRDFEEWKTEQPAPVVVIESAVMLEKPLWDSIYDFVITVSLDSEVRVRRTMARDGLTEDAVRSRLANQWNDCQREALADCIITTDDRHETVPELLHIVELFSNNNQQLIKRTILHN